jgi:hypothetical protein
MDDFDDKFSDAEIVESLARGLISRFHSELINARIRYLFVPKAFKVKGRTVAAKVSKVSGKWEYLTDADYLIEVSRPDWNDADIDKRTAILDHVLEHCSVDENEETGETKFVLRSPEVQEFSTIIRRHGAWTEELADFCSVAQTIDLSGLVQECSTEILQDNILDLN